MVGSNGSIAYADIDSELAAVMRNNIAGDLSLAVATIDDIIAAHYG